MAARLSPPVLNDTFRPDSGSPLVGESTDAVNDLPLTASATARAPTSPPSTTAPCGDAGSDCDAFACTCVGATAEPPCELKANSAAIPAISAPASRAPRPQMRFRPGLRTPGRKRYVVCDAPT